MPSLPIRRRIETFIKPFRVTDGKKFKLKHVDPDDTGGLKSKEAAAKLLAAGVERLCELQDKLYAQDRWSVLLVFQAMDAAGKDGTIKHVMSGVNPTGCQVFSFKAPVVGGAGPRLHVAIAQGAARARPHRHLQPLVLRRDARRPRASRAAARAETAAAAGDRRHLEGTLRGRQERRAVPGAQRRRRSSSSSSTCPRASRRSASSNACRRRTRTGSSRWPTPRSATSGTTISTPTRT